MGLGRSTVRGMSSVTQRDNDDDKEGIEDDAGVLQDQIHLLTQRQAKVKDADDKHEFESVGADGGDMLQDIPEASQAMFHHHKKTPRQVQDTSSKLDGDQECERNAIRTTFSGSVFSGSHSQGTPKSVDRNESCVETVSLDQNRPRGGKVHCSTKTRVETWQQYCLK